MARILNFRQVSYNEQTLFDTVAIGIKFNSIVVDVCNVKAAKF